MRQKILDIIEKHHLNDGESWAHRLQSHKEFELCHDLRRLADASESGEYP